MYLVRMPKLTPNILQTPSSSELLEKLERTASEEERKRKLFQVKIIYPGILNTSPDLETHVEQFLS